MNEMHNCDDIQFAEDGAWTSVRSKVSSSKTLNNEQNSLESLAHRISGLYFFWPVKSTAVSILKVHFQK